MKLTWLGHSSFMLDCDGFKIVTDPYDSSVGYNMRRTYADAVTCSHSHGDHSCLENILGDYLLINTVGTHTAGGVEIQGIPCFHDSCGGIKRGKNIIYKFTYGGVTVCHAGDLGEDFNAELVSKIGRADVLLLPVGGFYTVDAVTAKRYADALSPRAVVPMHYSVNGCRYPISKLSEFTSLYKPQIIDRRSSLDLPEALGGGFKVFILDF